MPLLLVVSRSPVSVVLSRRRQLNWANPGRAAIGIVHWANLDLVLLGLGHLASSKLLLSVFRQTLWLDQHRRDELSTKSSLYMFGYGSLLF